MSSLNLKYTTKVNFLAQQRKFPFSSSGKKYLQKEADRYFLTSPSTCVSICIKSVSDFQCYISNTLCKAAVHLTVDVVMENFGLV